MTDLVILLIWAVVQNVIQTVIGWNAHIMTTQGVVQTAVGSYLRQNATGTVSPVTWIASLTDGFDFGCGLLRDGYR